MTIQIPAPEQATKGRGSWEAQQDIKLGATSEQGDAVLRIRTSKGARNIQTSYSFGWVSNDRNFETFSCMIMTDYSSRVKHAATRATQKTVTEAHAVAMSELPVRKQIINCVAHQELEVAL